MRALLPHRDVITSESTQSLTLHPLPAGDGLAEVKTALCAFTTEKAAVGALVFTSTETKTRPRAAHSTGTEGHVEWSEKARGRSLLV